MDEPFGALDAHEPGPGMQAHLLRIWKEVDVTILFITHDLDEAVYLSDRIISTRRSARPHRRGDRQPRPRPRGPEQPGHFPATKRRLEEPIHHWKRDRNRTRKMFAAA